MIGAILPLCGRVLDKLSLIFWGYNKTDMSSSWEVINFLDCTRIVLGELKLRIDRSAKIVIGHCK